MVRENIYLVGFMGCGKSTLGRAVAKELNMEFIDLDKYIEQRSFKTVAQIFKEEGEEGFRKRESIYLNEVSQFEHSVIATGGGAPCFNNNMDTILEHGTSIYIRVSSTDLSARLINSSSVRPLIQNKSKEELISFIDDSLRERELFYNRSSIVVEATDRTTAKDIIKQLSKES